MKTKRRFGIRFRLRTLLLSFLILAPFAAMAGNVVYQRESELASIKAFTEASGHQFKLMRGGELEKFSLN